MQKKGVPIARFILFFLLAVGTVFTCCGRCVWAQDYYLLTVDFSSPESSKDIQVWIEIFEYTPGMTTLGAPVMQGMTNTKSSLNPQFSQNAPPGLPLSIPLPKGKKFLLRAEPIAGRTSPASTYQVKEANYQSQFYSRKPTFQAAITAQSFIDTGGSATSGLKVISLEPGYKIEGSIKKCGSSSTYIEGAMVKLYNEARVPVPIFGKSTGTGGLSGVNYTIYGLAPGKYYIMADASSKGYKRKFYKGSTGTDSIEDAELVEITNANVTGKNICLEEGYTVRGTILAPDGTPVQHGARVFLLDAAYNVTLGTYFYDPNSAAYNEFITRLQYYLSGGLYDLSASKNDPHYLIGGLDPNYSIGGSPKGALGECILVAMDTMGDYALNIYEDHYFLADADPITLKEITPTSTFDLKFRRAGTIEGSVKDKVGNPLPYILVSAIDANNESNIIQPVYTDPNGRYKLMGLPQIDLKIAAVDGVNHKYLLQYYKNQSTFAQATEVKVTEQSLNFVHIDFELEVGGRITGVIQDKLTGKAIPGVTVNAFLLGSGSDLANYPMAKASSGAGTSNAEGKYEIGGLPAGRYVLYAMPAVGDNYTAVFYRDSDTLNGADSNLVIDHPNQVIESCDFSLKKGGIIEGRITGIPKEIKTSLIGNIHVDLVDAKTGKLMVSTTESIDPNKVVIDPNVSEYRITGIPAGEYKIAVTDMRVPPVMAKKYYNKENAPRGVSSYNEASTIEINPGDNPIQIDFYWDSLTQSISGKVLADNSEQTPLFNIRVDAYMVEESSGKLLNTGVYDYTKATGMYCLKGLADGTYVLKAVDEMNKTYPTEFYDPGCNVFLPDNAARITLPLSSADTSFDFKLNSQIGIIDGVVTKGTAKTPFIGALVNLYSGETDQVFQSAITDPKGRYKFMALPEADFKIRAFDPDRGYVPRFYTSDGTMYAFNIADGESVTVTYSDPPASTHKNILLDKQGVQIEGTVKNSSGSPLEGIFMYLYQPSGNGLSFVADYYIASTDSAGKYVIKGLPSGAYTVLAWQYGDTYGSQGKDITLDQSGMTGLDFILPPVDTSPQTQEHTIEISEGLNLVCMPVKVPLWPSLYTVNTLLTEWAAVSEAGIVSFLHFDTEREKWRNQASSFLIENGEGYVVYSQKDKRITYRGELFPGQDNFVIDLQKGMNIVGNIKTGSGDYDSYYILEDLSDSNVSDIRSYDPVTGKWLNSTLFWGRSGGDKFTIYPTKAYIIDMKKPRLSWEP